MIRVGSIIIGSLGTGALGVNGNAGSNRFGTGADEIVLSAMTTNVLPLLPLRMTRRCTY